VQIFPTSVNLRLNNFHDAYIEQEIDEGVVAAVGHRQPVHAEPDDVDVRIAANVYSFKLAEKVQKMPGQILQQI